MIEYKIEKCPKYRQITITLEKEKYKDLILNARLDRCRIIKQQWQSIYSPYAIFNKEPYNPLNSKLDLINHLEGCLELEYEGSNNK